MKIGILTFHNSRNFGANLQTLATQEMLRKFGADSVIVNYIDKEKLAAFSKMVSPEQVTEHERFAQKYYNLSQPLFSSEEVATYCRKNLDGVVVGSDAVFRLAADYQPKRIIKRVLGRDKLYDSFSWGDRLPPFYLPFAAPTLRKGTIAASSRGTPFYFLRWGLMRQLNKALKDFDFISVRDDWTGLLVRWMSGGVVKPLISPDPVFGLNSSFKVPDNEQYEKDLTDTILFGGNFDRDWMVRMVNSVHDLGYRTAMLCNPEENKGSDYVDFNIELPLSPLKWFSCLAQCKGFIGLRFHAFVSCMANLTPVVTLDAAKPILRDHNPRNPNYDLAQRAGIIDNYFLQNSLMATDPETVLTRLFDPNIMARISTYVSGAPEQLKDILQHLWHCE